MSHFTNDDTRRRHEPLETVSDGGTQYSTMKVGFTTTPREYAALTSKRTQSGASASASGYGTIQIGAIVSEREANQQLAEEARATFKPKRESVLTQRGLQ